MLAQSRSEIWTMDGINSLWLLKSQMTHIYSLQYVGWTPIGLTVAVIFFFTKKKSIAACISICSSGSKQVNAIVVQLVDRQLLLI